MLNCWVSRGRGRQWAESRRSTLVRLLRRRPWDYACRLENLHETAESSRRCMMLPLKPDSSLLLAVFSFFVLLVTFQYLWLLSGCAMQGQGWVFLRMWEAQWAVDRSGCEKVLARACSDAGVRSGLGFDPDHAASPLRPRAQSVAPNSNGVSADDGMSPTSSGEVVRPSGVTSSTSAQSPSGLYDDEDVKLLMRHSSVGANDTALSAVAAKKTRKKGKTNAVLGEPQKPRDPIASMTVPALRDALRELDQDTSGRKSDLVDRLRAAQELENTNGAMMADFVVGAGAPNPKPRKQTAKRKQSTKAKKPVVATKKKRTAGNRRKKKRNNDAWVPSDDE
eukprot:INCI5127.2.p1 GENE.INCI5127.2~~INCI5127.2.p1  ORF type:complete len:336 (-),score=55.44 INCI5127.2:44-1051(-)